jgi:integrase
MPRRPDPTQGLEKRKGADGTLYYRAAVRIPGTNRKKRSRWTSNLAEARSARAKLLASQDALAAQAGRAAMPTVAAAADRFLTLAEEGKAWARGGRPYAPKTLRGYRQDFALWIEPALGEVPIDQLRRSQVQALVDEVAAFRSGQRARNVATALCALYRYLLPRHDELNDPTHGLELPSGSAPRNVIVTPDELLAMIAALDPADRPAFALAGMAGLRAGELKGLLVTDAVLDDDAHPLPDRIVVRAGWDAVEGRKATKHRREGEGREVPIFAPLRPHVEAQLASLGPEVAPDYPFLPGKGAKGSRIGRGLPLDTDQLLVRCRRAWGLLADGSRDPKAEVVLAPEGFRLHDARHSFASHLIVAGYDVATVAEWVGHAQPSTTLDRYVKPLRQRGVDPAAVRAYLGRFSR